MLFTFSSNSKIPKGKFQDFHLKQNPIKKLEWLNHLNSCPITTVNEVFAGK